MQYTDRTCVMHIYSRFAYDVIVMGDNWGVIIVNICFCCKVALGGTLSNQHNLNCVVKNQYYW